MTENKAHTAILLEKTFPQDGLNNAQDAVCVFEFQVPKSLDYRAGQYVVLSAQGLDPRPFSIASYDAQTGRMVLHLKNSYQGLSRLLFESQPPVSLFLHAILGDVVLQKNAKSPLVMIAGGVGYAQMAALITELQKSGQNRPVSLYCGGRTAQDLYFLEMAKNLPDFVTVHIALSEDENPAKNWHRGNVGDIAMQDINLLNADIYMAGPPAMIVDIMTKMNDIGVCSSRIFCDMVERPQKTMKKDGYAP